MGTLGGGNGGERPYDGGNQPERLRGLPPEWGTVIVPDDPAELAEEAAEVRRQLRRSNRRERWRRWLRLPARATLDEPSIGLPLLIMAIAVVATLTSLFAVAWPKPQRQAFHSERPPVQIAEIALVDANGTAVRLRDVLPAVVVLVDGCQCAGLLAELSAAAGHGIAVLAVGRRVPPVTEPPALHPTGAAPDTPIVPVRPLADPSDSVRTRLRLPAPAGTASVALISRSGQVVRLVPQSRSVDEFRADLALLR